MPEEIKKTLVKTAWIKAKDIAKLLTRDKSEVNSLLYGHPELFQKDGNHCWACVSEILKIEFATGWVDCNAFESALEKSGSPLETQAQAVSFVVPKGGHLLLEAIARLMALCNQVAQTSKTVTIDFTEQYSTLSYVNRLGFFDYLDQKVIVLPSRPKTSAAQRYKDNSDNLVELGAINPNNLDETIPERFKKVFVALAGQKYEQTAFTVISESFGNVRDHSESPIPGFIGLQCYKKTSLPHIQTVISDSGKGILGTLKPILTERYSALAEEIAHAELDSDVLLLKKVFTEGKITQSEDEGRGLGLNSTTRAASKFDAKILVRQENCEVKFFYRKGKLTKFLHQTNMPTIQGTHICFDFLLDQSE